MKIRLKLAMAAALISFDTASAVKADIATTRPAPVAVSSVAASPAAPLPIWPRASAPVKALAPVPQAPESDLAKVPVPTPSAGGSGDLRELIGVNPGIKRVEMPHMPAMSLRGFIQRRGQEPMALLEIKEMDREFLVQTGTEIPITVTGRITPIGRDELTGLGAQGKSPTAPVAATDVQSQIILTVKKVTGEGVIIETGLMAQTIIVR